MQHVELRSRPHKSMPLSSGRIPVVPVRTVEFERDSRGRWLLLGRGGIALVSWVLWRIGEPARVDPSFGGPWMPTQAVLIAEGRSWTVVGVRATERHRPGRGDALARLSSSLRRKGMSVRQVRPATGSLEHFGHEVEDATRSAAALGPSDIVFLSVPLDAAEAAARRRHDPVRGPPGRERTDEGRVKSRPTINGTDDGLTRRRSRQPAKPRGPSEA